MRASRTFEPEAFEFPVVGETEVLGTVDTRRCLTSTTGFPFRYVCNLEDGGGPLCSGTLIGPRTVLTAGHCLEGLIPLPGTAAPMRVIPARNDFAAVKQPFGSTLAAATQPARGADVGVVILRDPIGLRTGWWTFDPFAFPGDPAGTRIIESDASIPAVGSQVDLSGYPCDRPEPTHLGGRPDPCFRPTIQKGTLQYHDRNGLANVSGGILEYFNDTSNCQSGSPVWFESAAGAGRRMLVGVHITGNAPPDPPEANRGVLITGAVRLFVRAHSFSPPGTTPPGRPQVRFGSRGSNVEELQFRLNIWILTDPASGQARLNVDGIFGPRTLSATRAFQRAMALQVDGIVGPKTWARLQLPF